MECEITGTKLVLDCLALYALMIELHFFNLLGFHRYFFHKRLEKI